MHPSITSTIDRISIFIDGSCISESTGILFGAVLVLIQTWSMGITTLKSTTGIMYHDMADNFIELWEESLSGSSAQTIESTSATVLGAIAGSSQTNRCICGNPRF